MPQKYIEIIEHTFSEFLATIIKIIIPVFVAISVKLGIQMKKEKVTFFRALISYAVGISSCYLVYPIITRNFNEDLMPMIIGLFAITSEKIGEYFVFKLNIDKFLNDIFSAIKNFIIKQFK